MLVNNAGAFWSTALAGSPPDQIIALTQVNLLGAMLVTRAVLPGMLHRSHGAIVTCQLAFRPGRDGAALLRDQVRPARLLAGAAAAARRNRRLGEPGVTRPHQHRDD